MGQLHAHSTKGFFPSCCDVMVAWVLAAEFRVLILQNYPPLQPNDYNSMLKSSTQVSGPNNFEMQDLIHVRLVALSLICSISCERSYTLRLYRSCPQLTPNSQRCCLFFVRAHHKLIAMPALEGVDSSLGKPELRLRATKSAVDLNITNPDMSHHRVSLGIELILDASHC